MARQGWNNVVRAATTRGLYVLDERQTVRVYCKASGRVIGFWDPRDGDYHFGQTRGNSRNPDEVMTAAAAVAEQVRSARAAGG